MALGVSVMPGWSLIIIEMVAPKVLLFSTYLLVLLFPSIQPSLLLLPQLSGWFLRLLASPAAGLEPFPAEAASFLSTVWLLPRVFRGG